MIAGNWKMHGLAADGLALTHAVAAGAAGPAELVVCPPATLVAAVAAALAG
ncbi:triose-phosphate isomerase, partial [Roseomonas rosulenta]|uniref:triose-phosphate isomerase n=1 Tax=Roseomonas rosulenta TaxID=2748667 RepID=UPI002106E9D5